MLPLSVQHPGFSTVVDVDEDAYALEAHGWFSSQVAPVRRPALEVDALL